MAATLAYSATATAITDTQFDAVKRLGALNGEALNCGYIDETRRMKRSLVTAVPKIRIIGKAFDDATNEAFLAMVSEKRPCPSERNLSERVDREVELLQQQFEQPEKLF